MFRRHILRLATPFDAVFVINLDHRRDRWESISRQLTACGAASDDIMRYSAIDGAAMSPEHLAASGLISELGLLRLRRPPQEQIWGMDLTNGGVGCALSHIHLWAQVAARQLECALVLEDDSLLQPDMFAQFQRRFPAVPADWELVYLSGLDTEGKGPLMVVADGVRRVPQMHRTTNAYVVSARGARRLLDTVVPLTFQLDTEMTTRISSALPSGEMAVTGLPCYSLHPPLVVQATRFGSDIQGAVSHDTVAEEASRCRVAGWEAPPTNVN
jgi:GR25 family glycosyltransferase involved in LPS biosynthesis